MSDKEKHPQSGSGDEAKTNPRHANRIAAMQFLYSWDTCQPANLVEFTRQFFTTQEEKREFYSFAEELVSGAIEHISETDEAIRLYAKNWAFDRIAKVDLAILRLAIYELLHRRDIPPVVTINEAIELAKIFSASDAKRFINGILDRVKAQLNRPLREAARD
ncbi:MAG: transcription antitermination factor NusB [Puniceicoccales bacterium]|jgi:N utilization substance protein B|nr:transcription antitermination factor NusB [Puniceicoccales bacterium]